MDEMAEND
ncbi:hypothetical protein A2U01_0100832, partial [Trifolium medium]|nr:hypothetical protein [Trifolium medium]